ncbi:MAG: 30S ribosome-binding factor RbfA [Candidatus Aminicenantes bacterium]|nr:30S ribosome-binding factor RbfA [Candidatus Aminicenantes bacterium]
MSHRAARFSSTLKQCLADVLLNEVQNPHLKSVSIAEVTVSDDLKKADVFVSSESPDADDLIANLTNARGFIKRVLAKKMYLKYMPELYFKKKENDGNQNEEESR